MEPPPGADLGAKALQIDDLSDPLAPLDLERRDAASKVAELPEMFHLRLAR